MSGAPVQAFISFLNPNGDLVQLAEEVTGVSPGAVQFSASAGMIIEAKGCATS